MFQVLYNIHLSYFVVQKHQVAINELWKEKKAWRDKTMQDEVRFYNEVLSKDCEVTVIHCRINVILKQLIHHIYLLMINMCQHLLYFKSV